MMMEKTYENSFYVFYSIHSFFFTVLLFNPLGQSIRSILLMQVTVSSGANLGEIIARSWKPIIHVNFFLKNAKHPENYYLENIPMALDWLLITTTWVISPNSGIYSTIIKAKLLTNTRSGCFPKTNSGYIAKFIKFILYFLQILSLDCRKCYNLS